MTKNVSTRQISVNIGEDYDVIVCGGGTAGCAAAIASARGGAKTLLIERSFSVGGMLTIGSIRPTVQCMILGEAAGTAAALSVKEDVTCRQVDIQKLQAKLRENGAIL